MTERSTEQMRRDALAIWRAGVEAVQPRRLVRSVLSVDGDTLWIAGEPQPLSSIGRIVVVGGGKAGAAMAAAVEEALGERVCREKQLGGWVNVPADCIAPATGATGCLPASAVKPPRHIHLHAGRPAGVNEPRPEGVVGTAEILRLVAALQPDDLCLCLIGGGGSALLPAPVEGVTLDDKLALTRYLSAAGANIRELNTVRKHLSRIKGGGLARACRAGRLVSLIISDVIGDPLDVIASGPTVPDETTAADALAVLDNFGVRAAGIAPSAVAYLQRKAATFPSPCTLPARATGSASAAIDAASRSHDEKEDTGKASGTLKEGTRRDSGEIAGATGACRMTNLVIGNLATAVDAAGLEAERRGYRCATMSAAQLEGPADDVGRDLADEAVRMRSSPGRDCLVSGGEPVVVLVDPARRGLGGRNQQLALAAGLRLLAIQAYGCLVLSGGTDGEDGPTDAAGAWVDAELLADAAQRGLDASDHLALNDAYHFFAPLGGLIRTGPTQTNVGDLRIVLVDRTPPAII